MRHLWSWGMEGHETCVVGNGGAWSPTPATDTPSDDGLLWFRIPVRRCWCCREYVCIFFCFAEKSVDGKLTVIFIPEAEDGKRVVYGIIVT